MSFLSREEAGRQLGRHLHDRGLHVDIVLGLPRGGVIVAAEVARILGRPVDALVVRKIGHPRHREFAVGALAEGHVVLLDEQVLKENRIDRAELQAVISDETERLHEYESKFHPEGPPRLAGKRVLIVDDGLATGSTAEAAVTSAQGQGAASVIIAVPVGSASAVARLSRVADEVISLVIDPEFMAVGQYYYSFPQATDGQVTALLHVHA